MFNPFGLPKSDEVEFIPFVLPVECSRVLYLTDIHIPYHNIEALSAAIQFGHDKRVDTIFIGGDFLDFYSLSTFERDPRQRGFADELEMGREVLGILRREFPDASMLYQLGNHEERFERYMRVKAPELLSVDEFRIDRLLNFDKLGIELIDGKRVAKAGKLNIVGHVGRGGASSLVNPPWVVHRSKTSRFSHHQQRTHRPRPQRRHRHHMVVVAL